MLALVATAGWGRDGGIVESPLAGFGTAWQALRVTC